MRWTHRLESDPLGVETRITEERETLRLLPNDAFDPSLVIGSGQGIIIEKLLQRNLYCVLTNMTNDNKII